MIDLSMVEGVARLNINRPEKRNALDTAHWKLLEEQVSRARDVTSALLVTASGDVFCSGADLGELSTFKENSGAARSFREQMGRALQALGSMEVPTVAFVHGACHGAGVAIALAVDICIASGSARFAIPPARMGIIYPQRDVDRLVGRVGRGAAARLLLAAEQIDAHEALRIGLVDLLDADAERTLAAIGRCVPRSVQVLKSQINGRAKPDVDAEMDEMFRTALFPTGSRART